MRDRISAVGTHIGVPVQLTKRTRLQCHKRRSNGLADREVRRVNLVELDMDQSVNDLLNCFRHERVDLTLPPSPPIFSGSWSNRW
jgi:hypothetical protein